MALLTFESSIQVQQTGPDTFQNVHPAWTWPGGPVVPGGLLMALAAASAYKTLPEGYALDNIHCQFLSGSKPDVTYTCIVQRLSSGKRFQVRVVTIQQNDRNIASLTLAFINASPWKGPAMTHSVPQLGKQRIKEITIDDLERGRGPTGGFMKFQRLPLVHQPRREPHTSLKPVVAHIIGPIKAPAGDIPHILGLLNLSDYHVLGGPPDLHGYSVGLPVIDDASQKLTETTMSMYTSLNHTVHIHSHDFRADEIVYIEITSPWTSSGRGMAHSKIFSQAGVLIASCVQEAYYVLKPEQKSLFDSKL